MHEYALVSARAWIALAAVLAAAAVFAASPDSCESAGCASGAAQPGSSAENTAHWPPNLVLPFVNATVAVRTLSVGESSDSYIEQVIRGGVPVLLRNTVAARWPAIKRWKMSYLQSFLGKTVLSGRNSTLPTFIPSGDRQISLDMRQTHVAADFTMATFREQIGSPHYLYYSGDITDWGVLAKDIDVKPFERSGQSSMSMIWMGHAGVVANTHYDTSLNFHAQIVGYKRWTLFPPTAADEVYPFSSLHPHYRQSQVDFAAPLDHAHYPRAAGARGSQVVVAPGEVLFVPPFWFHRVETVELAVSLSVLSPSDQEVAALRMAAEPNPLADTRHLRESILLAWHCTQALVPAMLNGTAANDFVRETLLGGRYAAMLDAAVRNSPLLGQLSGNKCFAADRAAHLASAPAADNARPSMLTKRRGASDATAMAAKAAEWVARLMTHAAPLGRGPASAGVVRLVAADLLERLAESATGSPASAALFFAKCFDA